MTDMNDRMFNVVAVSIRAQQEWPNCLPVPCKYAVCLVDSFRALPSST